MSMPSPFGPFWRPSCSVLSGVLRSHGRDLNLAVDRPGWKSSPTVPLRGGAQPAVDTTLVSPLNSAGRPRRRGGRTRGAALVEARLRKERAYPANPCSRTSTTSTSCAGRSVQGLSLTLSAPRPMRKSMLARGRPASRMQLRPEMRAGGGIDEPRKRHQWYQRRIARPAT